MMYKGGRRVPILKVLNEGGAEVMISQHGKPFDYDGGRNEEQLSGSFIRGFVKVETGNK